MEITEERLRQTYEPMTSEQLLALRARGTLTDLAQRVLDGVLDERRVSPADRDQMAAVAKQEMAQEKQKTLLLASFGMRFLGQFLDLAFVLFVITVGYGIALVVSVQADSTTAIGASIGGFTLLGVLYWLLADGLPGGQSFGKRVLGTAVVAVTSMRPCGYSQSVVRNLVPLVLGPLDLLPLLGEKRQRLGDLIAGTMVINLRHYQGPEESLQAAKSKNTPRNW